MEQGMNIDFREMLDIIRRRLWIIIITTMFFTLVSGVVSYFIIPPVYEAKTSIIIGKEDTSSGEKERYNYNDVMMYQQMAKTYAEIAKSRAVAEKTAEKLGEGIAPEDVLKGVAITPQANTQIIIIKFKDGTAEGSREKANALAEVFIDEAKRLYPSGSVQIMDKAVLPAAPVSPRPKLNMAIAFITGLMLSAGIIFVLEYMDSTIKTEEDIEKYLNIPVIGIIPKAVEE